jgi:uncharacterized protein
LPDLQPTSASERHEILDVLRGFALYGVLLANLVWLTTDKVLSDARLEQLPTATVDPIARAFVAFFIDGKFYTLFAFLFGLGFSLQMHRAERRGAGIVPVYIRRLSVLLFIGGAHIALLWYGDILVMYALLGFVLLLFRRAQSKLWLVVLALVLALFARTAFTAYHATTSLQGGPSTVSEAEQDAKTKDAHLVAFLSGYPQVVRENVRIYWNDLFVRGVLWFALPAIFARFLLGLYAGKRRLEEQVAQYLPRMRRALPWLAGIGVVGWSTNNTWSCPRRGGQSRPSRWSRPASLLYRRCMSAGCACCITEAAAGRSGSLNWAPSAGWRSRTTLRTACCIWCSSPGQDLACSGAWVRPSAWYSASRYFRRK